MDLQQKLSAEAHEVILKSRNELMSRFKADDSVAMRSAALTKHLSDEEKAVVAFVMSCDAVAMQMLQVYALVRDSDLTKSLCTMSWDALLTAARGNMTEAEFNSTLDGAADLAKTLKAGGVPHDVAVKAAVRSGLDKSNRIDTARSN